MSEFVSWIKYKDEVYFLKNSDLDTKEGKAIYPKIKDDICGHGAILEYYLELKGKSYTEGECTDFNKPSNFPKKIAEAIKKGQMNRIGFCLGILNEAGKAEYEKIEQPAWAEYEKIRQPALAEYEKIRQPAWAEYEKIKQAAFSKIVSQKKYRVKEWRG